MTDLITSGPLITAFTAIEERLKTFFPTSHFGHGVVPSQLTPQVWARLVQRTPWIGIGWSGVQPDPASGRQFKGKDQITVFCVVKNEGGPRARLLGDSKGPGILGLVQMATLALQGMEVPGVGHIEVIGTATLQVDGWRDEAAEVAGVSCTVNFALSDPRALEDFLRLGVQWEFDPTTGPVTQGPADEIQVAA